jgi:transposase
VPPRSRDRRDERIKAGIFGELTQIARESYDRIVGLVLQELAIDGCIAKAPGGGECAVRSPVDRGKLGMKRSLMVQGRGIPLGRVLAPANRHDCPLLAPTLDKLGNIGPLPDDITVHLDAGYDSQKTRDELAGRGMTGEIAHKGDKAPIQAGQRWHVERTNAWHNSFNRLQRCYERREEVIDAFFDLADASSQSVGSSVRYGPSTGGTAARQGDHDHLPIRAVSYSSFVARSPRHPSVSRQGGPVRRRNQAATPARGSGGGDQGSDTGPDALMICWKVTGGLDCEHLPPDLAPIARMLSWYVPWPLMPAYWPVPCPTV